MASRKEYTETQETSIMDTGLVVKTLEIEAGAIQGMQDGIVQGIGGGAVRVIDLQESIKVSRWVEVHVFTFSFLCKVLIYF
jgi:Tfp pilus assembly PilM family ATPase